MFAYIIWHQKLERKRRYILRHREDGLECAGEVEQEVFPRLQKPLIGGFGKRDKGRRDQ